MANPEHVAILKQGVEVWNRWRGENPEIVPDLGWDASRPDLSHLNLTGVNLKESILRGANFKAANLENAILVKANLWSTNLSESILIGADLTGANLRECLLWGSVLDHAVLGYVDFFRTILMDASLKYVNLDEAIFKGANLQNADLEAASLWNTIFYDTSLKDATGLDDCKHEAPSCLDQKTLQKSGALPLAFLRGCGLSDWEIESTKLYQKDITEEELTDITYAIHRIRGSNPIQINPLFISYSHADATFVDRMEIHLNKKGIRFWRDIHDATSGRLEKQIDRAMRLNPTVLLILSKNSTQSDWVEHEASLARDLEKQLKRDVLCPVALDDSWKTSNWPRVLRRQIEDYNILDFSKWEDDVEFGKKFDRLVKGLGIFYKES
jgi:uncharacterized protein YjbI with pentapeptide repeats